MASRLKYTKHTLDSDEEDDSETTRNLTNDEIEGQEDETVDVENGIRFTPFHMKDEMQEGVIDENGMYIFKKNKNEIRDVWIEEINWSDVKQMEKTREHKRRLEAQEDEEEEVETNETTILTNMLTLMNPQETVTNAIKRLGKNSSTTGSWKNKRAKVEHEPLPECSESTKEQLSDLIGYADKLLSNGMFSVYQETYESLKFKLSEKSKPIHTARAVDTDLDIFGSSEPQTTDAKESKSESEEIRSQVDNSNISSEDVQWEFKWTDENDAEIHGPFTSDQMMQWQEEGYFQSGVFVRKSSEENTKFYSSRRIDFGLYA